jgi:hypothetical protein
VALVGDGAIGKAQEMRQFSQDTRPVAGGRPLRFALWTPAAAIMLAGALLVSGCEATSLAFHAAKAAAHILPPVGKAIADQLDTADESIADPRFYRPPPPDQKRPG